MLNNPARTEFMDRESGAFNSCAAFFRGRPDESDPERWYGCIFGLQGWTPTIATRAVIDDFGDLVRVP